MKYNVTIKGLVPLLQHRFSEEKLTKAKTTRTGDRTLTEEAKKENASQYLYTDKKGKLVQPSNHVEAAMIKVASEFRLAGAGKKTYKDIVKAGVFVFPENIIHKNQKWEVDSRSVVINGGGRVMSYRPRLEEWELSFEVEVTDPRADPEVIKGILVHAGLYKGLGSYRPRFGRFSVTEFSEIKEKKTKK